MVTPAVPFAPLLARFTRLEPLPAVEVEVILKALPVVKASAVIVWALPVAVGEVKVNSLLVVSQPKPAVSEVILLAVVKKAIWPAVPEPAIPPEPVVQVTAWFDALTQTALPVPALRLLKVSAPLDRVMPLVAV